MDISAKSILAGNIVSIMVALFFGFDLAAIMWLYWIESLMIGFFTVLRLFLYGSRNHELFSATLLSGFFIIPYGLLHIGYIIFFLTISFFASGLDFLGGIFFATVALLAAHAGSFTSKSVIGHEEIPRGKHSIDAIVYIPYQRILPMHITIIVSGFLLAFFDVGEDWIVILIFMGLKSLMDVGAHEKEHKHLSGNSGFSKNGALPREKK
jgi:hypothetical protein